MGQSQGNSCRNGKPWPVRLTLRLPFESKYSSSPRSTRIMILSVWAIEMLALSWCVVTLSLFEQSGSCKTPSRCQGPIGSRSEGVSSVCAQSVNQSSERSRSTRKLTVRGRRVDEEFAKRVVRKDVRVIGQDRQERLLRVLVLDPEELEALRRLVPRKLAPRVNCAGGNDQTFGDEEKLRGNRQ